MEVDFLCSDLRIALELDGAQHLASVDAYRRDRRKDLLLQQNGYLVLRFLAEDLGKCLDQVLDSILAAIVHQRARQASLSDESRLERGEGRFATSDRE